MLARALLVVSTAMSMARSTIRHGVEVHDCIVMCHTTSPGEKQLPSHAMRNSNNFINQSHPRAVRLGRKSGYRFSGFKEKEWEVLNHNSSRRVVVVDMIGRLRWRW